MLKHGKHRKAHAQRAGALVHAVPRPGRVLRLMKFLDALIQMSDHVASKGGPVPSWILEDVLDAGLLEARYVATARAAMARDKGLRMSQTRQLLRRAVDDAKHATW